MTNPRETSFDLLWANVGQWDGWLRPLQARALWDAASRVPRGGRIVEIGSYRGKSAAILAVSSSDSILVEAIDPHAGNDRGPGEWIGTKDLGSQDHEIFMMNLDSIGVTDKVRHIREYSQRAYHLVDGPIDFLYVDGAHGYRQACEDLVGWGGRVVDGGEMYVHDVFNSVWVTASIFRHLAFSRSWRYQGRVNSMAMYRREPIDRRDVLKQGSRQVASSLVLMRALTVRLLRRLKRESWARVLGHSPGQGLY